MKKILFFFCAILLVVCVVTCPSEMDHKTQVGETLAEVIKHEALNSNNGLTMLVGGVFGGSITDYFMTEYFEYHNYLLFSTGKINDRIISFGILNNIYSISAKELLYRIDNHTESPDSI